MSSQSHKYEENYNILETITESLNKDEVGIDDLVEKTREALNAARTCMEILNRQKGEFQKLEKEFAQLLDSSEDAAPPLQAQDFPPPAAPVPDNIGEDDPF